MKRFLVVLMATALIGFAPPAKAEDATIPQALQSLKEEGGEIIFMGHALGVDGWLIVNAAKSDRKIAYTTPEGGILMGILLNPDGTNQTNEQLKTLQKIKGGAQVSLPGADRTNASSAKSEKLYAEVEKASWAKVGDDAAPYLYLFVNTTCNHCQEFWSDLKGPVKSGRLQVRIVPYGQKELNRLSGAALLSVDDPAASWDAFIKGDKEALGVSKIKKGKVEAMDANSRLYMDWKLQGPPFALYRRPMDGKIMAIAGRPSNTMVVLADLMKKE